MTEEMPEVDDFRKAARPEEVPQLARIKKENEGKERITIRLDADVLAWFKAQVKGGGNYQTLINSTLRAAMDADEASVTVRKLREVLRELLHASSESRAGSQPGINAREFVVSIDEIRQNIVFGERFTGSYVRSVTLSDGSQRTIKLTPMVKDCREVVELDDSGHISYMGLHSTTTNGNLMVRIDAFPDKRNKQVTNV
jgi:uncharacterized protein (DUF4415 family)